MRLQQVNRFTSRMASRIRSNVAVNAAKRLSEHPSVPQHHLILYEYEASPWCRLVREYATILDLTIHIRPCPRQTLFLEGAFDSTSRFRPEAMEYLKTYGPSDSDSNLTFPILVDRTNADANANTNANDPIVILQSYDILKHLWERYGQSVLTNTPRLDQQWNSTNIPFPLRFLSLAAPSYFRPLPTCGLMRTPSLWNKKEDHSLVLYQAEGCPDSRLVREVLCTLEIPYLSVAAGTGTTNNSMPNNNHSADNNIPVLVDGDTVICGADACTQHLWNKYRDPNGVGPKWWDSILPEENLGRAGSFGVGAYTAFVKGNRSFIPDRAFQ